MYLDPKWSFPLEDKLLWRHKEKKKKQRMEKAHV
jgi:hypothetical protein